MSDASPVASSNTSTRAALWSLLTALHSRAVRHRGTEAGVKAGGHPSDDCRARGDPARADQPSTRQRNSRSCSPLTATSSGPPPSRTFMPCDACRGRTHAPPRRCGADPRARRAGGRGDLDRRLGRGCQPGRTDRPPGGASAPSVPAPCGRSRLNPRCASACSPSCQLASGPDRQLRPRPNRPPSRFSAAKPPRRW